MSLEKYTNDSLAIILLCSNLGINYKSDNIKPFTVLEWSRFAKLIRSSTIARPANLFNLSEEQLVSTLLIKENEARRIVTLMSRAGQLSFELNELKNMGINIMTRADKIFPSVLKEKLKDKCPPIIYYCGDINILNEKFIGVVGSRNVDEDGIRFTQKIALKIVNEKYSLVSGGAKGVDGISEEEVLKRGGNVISFIADSMVSKVRKKDVREAISNNKLLLMSTTNPKSGFTVYSAMDRNKYIYALSEVTVVIASDFNKGGTWTGAIENLKNQWTPILVRYGEKVPKGNKEILNKGGNPIKDELLNYEFSNLVKSTSTNMEVDYHQEDLLSLLSSKQSEAKLEEVEVNEIKTDKAKINEVNTNKVKTEEVKVKAVESIEDESAGHEDDNYDVYNLVLEYIIKMLKDELTLDEISHKLNVHKTQATDWLNRAVEDGKIVKLKKPIRYKSV